MSDPQEAVWRAVVEYCRIRTEHQRQAIQNATTEKSSRDLSRAWRNLWETIDEAVDEVP